MTTKISPLAGHPAPQEGLINVAKLVTAYYEDRPDPAIAAQRVAFGTSGHRGNAEERSFNLWHVQAITQAICHYRKTHEIDGPLFLGADTHALSEPACASALEVLSANGVEVMLAPSNEYTPTPAISHAILSYNRGRCRGFADGIVITPSHNPPRDGGFKYNPPHGGAAGTDVTSWIQTCANNLLEHKLFGVKTRSHVSALRADTTHRYPFMAAYVEALDQVIDMGLIRDAGIHMGVDPLGGAGVHYWSAIAQHYQLDLTVVNQQIDPTFRFMTLDWDGQIRMDPSSPYAMRSLLAIKDQFDLAFACDTDHDRHGIITPAAGLLPANHFQSVAIDYLFQHRPQWRAKTAIGKTIVSTQLIDRLSERLGRPLYETPVGFKWFAAGLNDGSLGFAGEESAGATFLRHDGLAWTTDKDGMIPALLAAEITARTGLDPGARYQELTRELGDIFAERVEAPASAEQKQRLAAMTTQQISARELAGDPITFILDSAPGNGEPIGGIKVCTGSGWFAARPSGTEEIYKIYAESLQSPEHLQAILLQAQTIVDAAISSPSSSKYKDANNAVLPANPSTAPIR
jgi:phosphoglucomutase